MSKIFTDAQIQEMRDEGHPVVELMEFINSHTNSRSYAAANLDWLAVMAEENFQAERESSRKAMQRRARKFSEELGDV